MAGVLLVEKSGGITTLVLDRPEKMNALSRELLRALTAAFRLASNDEETEVLILTGAGRAFCAGLDLKELSEPGDETNHEDTNVVRAMVECGKPIIGAVNGIAVTGGFEVALACDVLIASPDARFADTHARVGILPGWGLSQKLSRAIGIYRAKELSLTGNYLDAEDAAAWGLVNRVVPAEALLPTCRALADDMMSCLPDAMRAVKKLIDDGHDIGLGEALAMEREVSRVHMEGVTPEMVAENRRTVMERGRKQNA